MTERQIADKVAEHLQRHHPGVIYRFDLAADLKLTVGQAVRHKRLHPYRGYPDFFIAATRFRPDSITSYPGCFIELKRQGIRLKTKAGRWANDHVAEQAAMLERLQAEGYIAQFACGLDEAIAIVDSYLGSCEPEDDGTIF